MVLSLSNLNYRVCAPEGASGHFIGHFLHPAFKASRTDLRVDNLSGNNPIFEYTGNDDDGHSHDMNLRDEGKIIIRILTPTLLEKMKCVWNVYFKGNNTRFDSFQYIMNKHYMHLLDVDDKRYHHSQKEWAVDLDYNSIFNLYKLTELYYNVNKEVCPDYKIKYASNYIDQHVRLYNRWEYRAMEQIFVFEYANKLHECNSNRLRSWSIDDITKDNWQTLLKENLCLTSYH
tara:strand:+ start:91 stop:783 length:693 start_codon:yes stop_codon:yes gene_type:complete